VVLTIFLPCIGCSSKKKKQEGLIYSIILYNTKKEKPRLAVSKTGGTLPCCPPVPYGWCSSSLSWRCSCPASWYPLVPSVSWLSGCDDRVPSISLLLPLSTPRAVAHGGGSGCCCSCGCGQMLGHPPVGDAGVDPRRWLPIGLGASAASSLRGPGLCDRCPTRSCRRPCLSSPGVPVR
jgi:hypothetical protein